MTIRIKRAYAPPEQSDGVRFLVDHLWPRGLKKEALQVECWIQAVAPSNKLRSWFGHEPFRWKEFQRRYFAELNQRPEAWMPLLKVARTKDVTLVFSARDVEHNNAVALKTYLENRLARPMRRPRAPPGGRAATTVRAARGVKRRGAAGSRGVSSAGGRRHPGTRRIRRKAGSRSDRH